MSDEESTEPAWHAGIKLELRSMSDRLHRAVRDSIITPIFQTVGGSVTIPASGVAVIKFEGPEAGEIRYVRGLRVSGAAPTTTAAGRADVYVIPGDDTQTGANMPQTAWRDQATALPLVATYGRGEMVIKPRETLYLVFSSATAAQEYYASMTFEQISISADRTSGAMPL